jgi:xanthine dehydrogenase accessory factor
MFGAGHVGRAVAAALAPLPFDVTWVDARADEFPEHVPLNHTKHVSEDCSGFVDAAPPGALYLVFTHSHQMDYELTAKILGRGDAVYCGLIGSKTKRARFENRLLKERVVSEEDLPKLTCPIGVPGISGKEPEVIAASVAAQLLMVVS